MSILSLLAGFPPQRGERIPAITLAVNMRRWRVLAVSLLVVAAGFYLRQRLKPQFFPKDLSYLAYVDVWLPGDAPVAATDLAAQAAEEVLRDAAAEWGKNHPRKDGEPQDVLKSITTFVGGGGPRFWYSVEPELSQPNYAQIGGLTVATFVTLLMVPVLYAIAVWDLKMVKERKVGS